MKRTLFALAVSAMALVSCHQPTKEEQLKEQVMVVFNDYANENFKGEWSMDSVVFDTAGSSVRYASTTIEALKNLSSNPRFATPTIVSNFKQGLHIYDELDTTKNIVAVVYVSLNKRDDTVFYCGIRHGIVHSPKSSGRDALRDIHTSSEQALYDALESLMIGVRAIRMFIEERDDFMYTDEVYNIWVEKAYRIDPRKLD